MSRNQRLAIVAGALAVLVLAFVLVSPGDEDDEGPASAAQTATAPERDRSQDEAASPATTETAPAEPEPVRATLRIEGGRPAGGEQTVTARRGDLVRITISGDAPGEVHLHGYDIERPVAPGEPARLNFTANAEGVFELEEHDTGAVLAKVEVRPR
jgi:hypothetical protein